MPSAVTEAITQQSFAVTIRVAPFGTRALTPRGIFTTSTTVPTWLYQPPTATAQQVLNLQALTPAALPGAAPSLHSTIPHLAPLNGSIPAIPARFASAAADGEFVDLNELLHALESDSGEEPPIYVQVGEGQQLSLPRKPKKRVITAFHEWARCFCVYSHHLAAHQPLRGPDLLAYLYLIATCHTEYTFPACLAYDVAFRKKAGRFRLASWGNIDPQLYAKAFTGSGKARPRAWCDSCLTAQHSTADCLFFIPEGQLRRQGQPRLAPGTVAGPTLPARSAAISTAADATRQTAPVNMSASPVVDRTNQYSAPPVGLPQGSNDLRSQGTDTHPHTCTLQPCTSSPLPLTTSCITSHSHLLPPQPLVITPVQPSLLASLLALHPDHTFRHTLLQGFTFGFDIGYRGPHSPRYAPNLRSALARPKVIQQYLNAECSAGHTAGPFPTPPLPDLVINPLGAVPKRRSGKWRLIMHLSHPPHHSVNDGIDIRDFPLHYSTVYDAIASVMCLGRHSLMAKLDVKSAFRLCPVRPADHHLLGMKWRGQYYFDRVLPFGLRSAPYLFNLLAEAVEWIAKQAGILHIHHYLDDFFLAGAPDSPQCSQSLERLSGLCNDLGIPLAEEKLEGPTTCLEYLGILLDSSALEARLPPDKLQDIRAALEQWASRTESSKHDLLSLIGTLSFAAKVVPASRTFLRRIIDLSTTVQGPDDTITLSHTFQLDLQWWTAFVTPWNGRSFFLLPHWTPSPDLNLYTDSAGSIGFGAFCRANGSTAGGQTNSGTTASNGRTLPHCASCPYMGQTMVNPPPSLSV